MTLRHFDVCTSTSDLAREWVASTSDAAPDGAVVAADYQTAGRGRRGRVWQSEPGDNVLMSVVLRPPYDLSVAWRLAFVAAVGTADALDGFGVTATLKWPNDILVEGRKCGGILVETVGTGAGWAAIVGIGVNVNQLQFQQDATFDLSPISLRMATGREWMTVDVAAAVASELMAVEQVHRADGFASIASRWRSRMAPGLEIVRGRARGVQERLDDDGKIRVVLPDGTFDTWATVDG